MPKHWTQEEDETIVAYLELVGPFLGPHDLGRSAKSTAGRAGFLRRSGAWAAIERKWKAEHDYRMTVDPIYARMARKEEESERELGEMHRADLVKQHPKLSVVK